MQQSRLEELARQSPQLNDGVRRLLTSEFNADVTYYRLEEDYDRPDMLGEFGYIKRRSCESIGNDFHYGPFVESLEFDFLVAEKVSPLLRSIVVRPAGNTNGHLFNIHYMDRFLHDATFKAHSEKGHMTLRIIPPTAGRPVRIQIGDAGHTIDNEYMDEGCVREESGNAITLPYSLEYEGSTILADEKDGRFCVTVTEPGFVRPREASFPESLDARCKASFELGNTDWRFAPEIFGISWANGFRSPDHL